MPPAELRSEQEEDSINLARAAVMAHPAKSWYENPVWLWGFQGFMTAAFFLMAGYVVFWMDAHNDSRYIRRIEYEKDTLAVLERYKDNRENDRKDRDSIRTEQGRSNSDLNKRLDRMEQQQDTIANDIKSLLRQPRSP